MKTRTIVSDANILIDYLNGGKELLEIVCDNTIFLVPDVVLDEVRQLDHMQAAELGIEVLESPLELLVKAEKQLPGCSFQDTVCYLMALENGWICATNDKKLIRACKDSGIEVIRGLGLIIKMVEDGAMSRKEAVAVAENIAESNREITDRLMGEFVGVLDKVDK